MSEKYTIDPDLVVKVFRFAIRGELADISTRACLFGETPDCSKRCGSCVFAINTEQAIKDTLHPFTRLNEHGVDVRTTSLLLYLQKRQRHALELTHRGGTVSGIFTIR